MLKVHILDRCQYCNGKAYLPIGEATDWKCETFTRYAPCPMCEGTGKRGKWISLPDFLTMLKAERCKHEHTSYRGGMHFSAGDVWDDIEEYCIDCGANLDGKTLGDSIDDPQDNHAP
jgi:hypothetical protein